MSQQAIDVLEPQEKIVWEGVVSRKVMIFNFIISLIIIGGLSYYFFSQNIFNYTSGNTAKTIAGSTVGWVVLGVGLFFTVLGFLSNLVKKYTITDKRVLMKSGLIGTDFNSIYFTQVRNANVNVGLVDKIFSVGTINIDTGKIETVSSGDKDNRRTSTRTAYDKMLHIDNPYEVYKNFHTTLTGREESLYSGRADKENLEGKK